MTQASTRLSIGSSTLWTVPSIHFRLPFAYAVNRLASKHRPTAIAVELGPQTAAAAVGWLGEIGVDPNTRLRDGFPCMLGLTKPNPRLHPARRDEAMRLQRLTGRELTELPPQVLRDELGYSGVSVLYLSPTDSIVEGIRCALELDVPLYGIDLEETADATRRELLLQPPESSGHTFPLDQYVRRNGEYAEYQRDDAVDQRRELAMAARLKTILKNHQRVLFVCGLAHWPKLQAMLTTDDPRPAAVQAASEIEADGFRRVVIHPSLAIHHLDGIPALAEQYEADRPHAAAAKTVSLHVEAKEVFAEKLHIAYERYFLSQDPSQGNDGMLQDYEARHDFQQLLENLCVLRQRVCPDLLATLLASQGVMSESFSRVLAEVLMEFPWASPDQHPGTTILAPAPSASGQALRAEYIGPNGERSPFFYTQSKPGRAGIAVKIPIPWNWKPEIPPPPPGGRGREGAVSNWMPLDHLLSALTLRAVKLARDHSERPRTEAFEGSLYDGVDMKSTLRAVTRGDQRIYVKRRPRHPTIALSERGEDNCFPFIWLLRPTLPSQDIQWMFAADRIATLAKHTRDLAALQQAEHDLGATMISATLVSGPSEADPNLTTPSCRVRRQERFGQLSFNPVPSLARTAQWGEQAKYLRSPMVDSATYPSVVRMYQQRHRADFGNMSWPTILVLMAIPYAEVAVTVVAPDGYTLPRFVHQQAAARGLEIRVIPLSYFPADAIRKIRYTYWIPTFGRDEDDRPIYPEHVKRYFDQDLDIFKNLIPSSWR